MVTSRKSIPHRTRTDVNLKGRCSLARRFYVNCACLAVRPTPRDHDDYSLRGVRIRHNAPFLSAGVKDTIGALLPILSPALADLKILEVLISKVAYDGSWTLLYFPKSLQALLDRCTSLDARPWKSWRRLSMTLLPSRSSCPRLFNACTYLRCLRMRTAGRRMTCSS